MDGPLSPRESARFIAERSRDVSIDFCGVRRVAELLRAQASGPQLRVDGWKAIHELNPRAARPQSAGCSWWTRSTSPFGPSGLGTSAWCGTGGSPTPGTGPCVRR